MGPLGTCLMIFKKAPQGQVLEAWRILRHASKNRTLFEAQVEQWHDDIRLKYGEQPHGVWEEPAPGTAGAYMIGSAVADADVERRLAKARKKTMDR